MPHRPWREDRRPDDNELLRRIAEALEGIYDILLAEQLTTATGVNGMSLPVSPVAPGTTFTGTYTAVDASGNTVPGAITFESSDGTLLTATGDGSVSGVSVVTCDAIAAGTPILTASFTNPDGSVVAVGTNNPFTVTIAVAEDLVVAVNGV
jgi:hypothetical protein